MTIDEIINYVFSSPENTNPNVLHSMLSSLSGGAAESSGSESDVQLMKVEIDDNGILNKTWQEMYDAALAGAIIYTEDEGDKCYFMNFAVSDNSESYVVVLVTSTNQTIWFSTDTASGYPQDATLSPVGPSGPIA